MLRAAETVKERYPDKLNLKLVTGLPFDEYVRTMLGSDAIMDQLYSYTPSMNPLEAMAHGIICIGGGEPENYAILNETVLHPHHQRPPHLRELCRRAHKACQQPLSRPLSPPPKL